MTVEMIILLVITLFIWLPSPSGGGLINIPREAFKDAGPYLGGQIEWQLDTAAGFQEKALNVDQPLNWSGG